MLFSSVSFLYYFLPIVLASYFLSPWELKNNVLLLASLFFYFYGEPIYSLLMIISIISGYLHGLWINCTRGSRYAKIPVISSIIISIGLLVFFKYTDFFIGNVNGVFNTDISPLNIALPIGISFYTFQILSYTIDVYRDEAKVQKNILRFATYVSLFPQLIAGPIVRYTTIEEELNERTHSVSDVAYGINRFIIGLSKKVLIANTLGELVEIFNNTGDKTVLFYWVSAIAFMLQIYFDFSAYSDMAIGLGRIFGFHFLENFNYPFISKSISGFWRRWHISLGTWFRDYVYIPMGGNRVSAVKWIRNIIIVWFLTGFWHGAQWNFIIWGLYFALILLLEKYIFKKLLERLPAAARHLYMLFFITISFVIFNGDGMNESLENLKGMFGLLNVPILNTETVYYIKSYAVVFIIAAIGATPLVSKIVKRVVVNEKYEWALNVIEPILLAILMLFVTGYLIDGSFNPFLYFRF
ncbi:MAG: MBOAT family protein [Clostridiaceae bacterium]|jgi:alginate O-acetyltransferase complex protein AlgI|nr:MBOAT family protein [Clostridiaceae bacterium]